VSIEYESDNPDHSRIVGMRTREFGFGAVLVLLIPLVGAAFAMRGLRSGKELSALLARGRVARGRLCMRTPTNMHVNGRPVLALAFEFEAENGRTYTTVAFPADPDVLQDEETEQLVYDPQNPTRASMLDHLPGAPRIDENGRFAETMPADTIVVTMVPLLSVAALVAVLLW
jgi:hypothetical protein